MSDILFSHKNVEAFPVGSVFLSLVNTDPSELLGYGSWKLIGGRRMLMGCESLDDTGGSTGGHNTVTLSAANLPSHSHSIAQHTHQIPAHNHTASSDSKAHNHTITINAGGGHDHQQNGYTIVYTKAASNERTANTSGMNKVSGNNGSRTYAVGNHTHGASSSQWSHNHVITIANKAAFNTTNGGPTSTGSVGSGSAFDITNSYLKVFIWQRTA